jgi:hypothetical protein
MYVILAPFSLWAIYDTRSALVLVTVSNWSSNLILEKYVFFFHTTLLLYLVGSYLYFFANVKFCSIFVYI